MLKVVAELLEAGDVCSAFGEKILAVYTAGIKIPSGKVEVHILNKKGVKRIAFWNKKTIIGIESRFKNPIIKL